MAIPLNQIAGMQAYSPYYPMPPARYRHVKFHFVYFRTNPMAIDRILPECFTLIDQGLCVAIGISIPWSGNYGAFEESVVTVPCAFEGQAGDFTPVAFLNSRFSIPAGRENYGTPKVFADISVEMDERVMIADTRLAGASVLNIRSTMHREASIDEMPVLKPNWRLKVIPQAEGKGVDVMQLIDASDIITDIDVHECRSGDGVVGFESTPVFDLSFLKPISFADS